jgi:hypothetical protein
MPSTGGRKFGRKGANGPDTEDLKRAMNAIWEDFGASAEIRIYQDLQLDIIVEAIATVTFEGTLVRSFGNHQRWGMGGVTLPVVMFQCIHRLYHEIDKYALRVGSLTKAE